jgi:hypothetical protein
MTFRYFQIIGLLIVLPAVILFTLKGNCSQIVTKIVGNVGGNYLTSREVIASRIIENVLYPSETVETSHSLDSPLFGRQLTASLLERVIALEADSFSIANLESEELSNAIQKVQRELKSDRSWLMLQVTPEELKEWVERKVRSKKFLKYKTDSATLGVTDSEVKEYFEKNRYKFGNMTIENFKENIRAFLVKQQMEDRLKEWFEILKKKYKVRNYHGESIK